MNLLPENNSEVKVSKIAPTIGTEIRGLQLSQLNNQQKDELALLIAERGVVVFRDQDFKDIGVEKQKEFGEYFGPLHIHVRLNFIDATISILTVYLACWRSCQG